MAREKLKKTIARVLDLVTNPVIASNSGTVSVSLPASDAINVDVDMTKTGYVLVGIVGVTTSGSGSTLGYISSFRVLNDTTVRVSLRNTTATARSYNLSVRGLYIRGGVLPNLTFRHRKVVAV